MFLVNKVGLISILLFCTPSYGNVLPVVFLTFPQKVDVDVQDDVVTQMTNAHAGFTLHCLAPYPIQWSCFFEENDDGNSPKEIWSETRRMVGRFEDPTSYEFSAIFSVVYTGKLQTFTNFSCQSVDHWGLQTNVIMGSTDRKNVLLLEKTNSVKLPAGQRQSGTNSQAAISHIAPPPEICPTRVVVSDLEKEQSCWRCETNQGEELNLDFNGCKTAMECSTFYQRNNRGTECLQVADKSIKGPSKPCKKAVTDYNPKFIACKKFGVALVQFYYFSVVLRPNGYPYIYFSWEHIQPEKMLLLHPVPQELYIGEKVTIVCELSKFYFSYGVYFGLQTSRKMDYLEAHEPPSQAQILPGEEMESEKGTFLANVTFLVQPDLRAIYCFGPVWNSRLWINTSASVKTSEGVVPIIVEPPKDTQLSLILGDSNKYLGCKVQGKPFPRIVWTGPHKVPIYNSSQVIQTTNRKEMWSQIAFKEVTPSVAGEYTCAVSSFRGSAERKFVVTVGDSYKASLVIVTSVLVPTILIITVVIVFGWRKIKQQKKELRLLTETEVKEFVEGNPAVAASGKYLDDAFEIDALPYDKMKYEIPMDNLQIDHSKLLGSGAFGEVFLGQIKGGDYGNLPKNTFTFTVAIKRVKRDVDVIYFKALLSEIKIMGFLGKHRNVVSLIGANTGDIRNRQAYIAVEYCEKGSLDKYLANCRPSFVNYVQYGIIASKIEPTSTAGVIGEYYNVAGTPVSTFDLMKWAYDIAEGMDYLCLKKVIHGDLATRNVLLDGERNAKVGDFGLSRQLINSPNYFKKTSCPLPFKWMSPESLAEFRFSVHSDMWSYGVTLWEIFTLAESPYKGVRYTQEFVSEIQNGLRLDKPRFATNDIYELMLKCWNIVPEERPNYDEIKKIVADAVVDGHQVEGPN